MTNRNWLFSATAIALIAGRPWAVRSVTSSTRMPPATSARASGTAWLMSSMAMTGITAEVRMMSSTDRLAISRSPSGLSRRRCWSGSACLHR